MINSAIMNNKIVKAMRADSRKYLAEQHETEEDCILDLAWW